MEDELEKIYSQHFGIPEDVLEKILSKARLLKGRQRKEDELSKKRTKGAAILDFLERNLDAENSYPYRETTQEIDGVCFLCEEYFLSEQFTSYHIIPNRFGLGKKKIDLCKSCTKWSKSRPKKQKRRRNRTHEEVLSDIAKNGDRVRRNIESRYFDDPPTTEHADGRITSYHRRRIW